MKLSTPIKYQAVRDELAQAIRSGKFGLGEKLPAERELARKYGVSPMTARQAVTDLVDAELVERRPRSGVYVRSRDFGNSSSGTVNLIAAAYHAAQIHDFLNQATHQAEQFNWHSQVISLGPGQQAPAVSVLRRGGGALVMATEDATESPLREAMRQGQGRVVAIQWYHPPPGVPSVLYDERRTMEMAIEELKKVGHSDIAVVAQIPTVEISEIQIATWREHLADSFSESDLTARLIKVSVPYFESPSREAYAATRRYLEESQLPTTAMICLGDEITQGVLAACRDAGHPVAQHMSLISVGDAPLLTFTDPAITAIDVNFAAQVARAYEILKCMEENAGVWDGEPLQRVQPRLVSRGSVQPPSG